METVIQALGTVDNAVAISVGVVTLAGALKSMYNGYVRRIFDNIQRIERIDRRTQDMVEKQESNSEAIFYISLAMDDNGAPPPDPREVKKELDIDKGFARFSSGGAPHSYGSNDTERAKHRE